MLLIDGSQLALASCMAVMKDEPNEKLELPFVRHIILTAIKNARMRFYPDGVSKDTVFCCDDRGNYWRKNIFPYYKAARAKARDSAFFDFPAFYKAYEEVKAELAQNIPIRTLQVPTAEADDIIGVLARKTTEPLVIYSTDQDFLQLQANPLVRQFNPRTEKWIESKQPLLELKEKIIRGDSGDGIPSILSEDSILVTPGKRQSPMTESRFSFFYNNPSNGYQPDNQIYFDRNRALIDLSLIPEGLQDTIWKAYEGFKVPRGKLYNYLVKNGLNKLQQNAVGLD